MTKEILTELIAYRDAKQISLNNKLRCVAHLEQDLEVQEAHAWEMRIHIEELTRIIDNAKDG